MLALDRAPIARRSFDRDGRLRVAGARISKSAVNPYRGAEIPGFESLGLDPARVYKLLRDPAELEAAAPSFNCLPLLTSHVAVDADDHRADLVVGATGSNAEFFSPYLVNDLVIWSREAIDGIELGERREISAGYHYRPEMRPGVHQGVRYDGVMRDIVGNHCALVSEGRAGADVAIGMDARVATFADRFPQAMRIR